MYLCLQVPNGFAAGSSMIQSTGQAGPVAGNKDDRPEGQKAEDTAAKNLRLLCRRSLDTMPVWCHCLFSAPDWIISFEEKSSHTAAEHMASACLDKKLDKATWLVRAPVFTENWIN